jgi:VHL beta domain
MPTRRKQQPTLIDRIHHVLASRVEVICSVVTAVVAVLTFLMGGLAPLITLPQIPPSSIGQSPVVASTNLQARSCSEATALRSRLYDTPAVIQFVNKLPETVHLYWISYSGARESYGNMSSGESLEFDTYLTHPWLITNATGQCIAIFLPTKKPGNAVIQ